MNDEGPKKLVTMRDISAAAGVNQSTVSRALRNDPKIPPETCSRIRALAERMRYRPNPFVTAFTTHVRNHRALPSRATIGVLDLFSADAPHIEWQSRYMRGIEARAAELGFCIDLLRFRTSGDEFAKIDKIVNARGIRGVIVLPVDLRTALSGVDFDRLAAATIDLSLQTPRLHRATPDYFQGIQIALDELRARGRRRIGFCTNRAELVRIGSRWLGGCLAWQAGHPPAERVEPHVSPFEQLPPGGTKAGDKRWMEYRKAFERWLDKEKPDAIVSNDFYFGEWLRELGFAVPRDIAFASLGAGAGITPRLGGIDQRGEQIGAAAVDLVAGQIYRNEYGLPAIPSTVTVPSVWVDGDTTQANSGDRQIQRPCNRRAEGRASAAHYP